MRRRVKRWTLPLLASLIAAPLAAVSTPLVAAADTTPVCRSAAPLFTVRQNGDLAIFGHEEPENGQAVWSGGEVKGTQWTGRTIAGPDGVLYNIPPDGALKRLRWNGSGWDNNGQAEVIGVDWQRFTTDAYRNRITVDETGRIYTINDKGELRVYLWDAPNKKWLNAAGDVIGVGWDRYDSITAGGAGVLYARKPTGELIRYRYHAESQRYVLRDQQVGTGWNGFKRIFSPGGDVLYGVRPDGVMLWYRYIESSGTWVGGDTTGVPIGSDWQNDDVSAMSDACKLTSVPSFPQRVGVPLDSRDATHVMMGKDGVPQYFYVNDFGQTVHGKQVNSTDPRSVQLQVVDGNSLTKTPSAVLGVNDRLQAFALGQDGETRTTTQTADGLGWSGYSSLGGFTPGPAAFVRDKDNLVRGFAVDAAGKLWTRSQATVDGPLIPWAEAGGTNLTSDFVVIRSGDGFELVARTTAGDVTAVRYDQAGFGAWRAVPGGAITGKPAAVLNLDGKLDLYARRADGLVHWQRETRSGFTGIWASISGLTAVGSPAAAAVGGVTRVSVRSTDNYVHTSMQSTPGGTSYTDWSVLADSRTGAKMLAATDPAMATVTNGSGVLITFRDPNDVSGFYASAGTTTGPTAVARSAAVGDSFTGGPQR
ncbi:tachylectin-related carbohydrate-binding protein [Lentzea sp. BCCO 10_0798]|uniref:Tachylectin-related carbohydrate-binding protein n=1 Tax=Lentzea kristufekii TaxID=3095430 RepID=A0ABU4TL35_9PSEU|nr:tachylectin-related carbohydrate-binding protein [Lentzea sp. BCCO 10_0798]MDX8048571.1 tachylectin-related carbohydrate-binding protein [Lentzea sp. BCCO 10_0798]